MLGNLHVRFGGGRMEKDSSPVDRHCRSKRTHKRIPAQTEHLASRLPYNEPYAGGVALDWQARIARVIAETESGLPKRHMIAQNVANGSARITDPIPGVSLFNFHYAHPPRVLAENAGLDRPIGDDETGFR